MQLTIDHIPVTPHPGQTLRDLICRLGLDDPMLSCRPIAAKIAGEVFNLNYIPLREKDLQPDRPSMRTAMAASGGVVSLLRCTDPTGREVYERTAQFLIFLALGQLWPEAKAKMNCTLGPALFIEVEGAKDFSVETLRARLRSLVNDDIPLLRSRMSTEEAVDREMEDDGAYSEKTVEVPLVMMQSCMVPTLMFRGVPAVMVLVEGVPEEKSMVCWGSVMLKGRVKAP